METLWQGLHRRPYGSAMETLWPQEACELTVLGLPQMSPTDGKRPPEPHPDGDHHANESCPRHSTGTVNIYKCTPIPPHRRPPKQLVHAPLIRHPFSPHIAVHAASVTVSLLGTHPCASPVQHFLHGPMQPNFSISYVQCWCNPTN